MEEENNCVDRCNNELFRSKYLQLTKQLYQLPQTATGVQQSSHRYYFPITSNIKMKYDSSFLHIMLYKK